MSKSFFELTPHAVMRAIEKCGYQPTGEFLQLNSYENRVFDLRLEKGSAAPELQDRLIAKFYRPGRWSESALLDEHHFLMELKNAGVPVVAPLLMAHSQSSLFQFEGMWVALFPKYFGRMPQELLPSDLKSIGRTLAQIHNIGGRQTAKSRMTLTAESYGAWALPVLKAWVPGDLWPNYEAAALDIFAYLDDELVPDGFIRIHGDCHRGNLLRSDDKSGDKDFFFVDFDDFINGPPEQDFWMLLKGLEPEAGDELLNGYEELRHLEGDPFPMFEPLRGLRIINYAGWIASRWHDPSFPRIFSQFNTYNYWAEEAEALQRIAWQL